MVKLPEEVETRISRLTFNKNGWLFPSGPEGKSRSKSYEKENGFGHEEWLLNPEKKIGGYVYGFLEPVHKFRKKYIGRVFNICLYTVNSLNKETCWVGKINNVEVIDYEMAAFARETYRKRGWYEDMKEDLKRQNISGDKLDLWDDEDLFNVRYRYEDFLPVPPGTLVDPNDNPITSYYYVLLKPTKEPAIFDKLKEEFVLGKHSPNRRYKGTSLKRKFEERNIQYAYTHDQISFGLEQVLKKTFDHVYPEHETAHNSYIDMVAVAGKEKYFYEIKTYPDIMTCIRVALGQLLEYAFYPGKSLADRLYIVTPHFVRDAKIVNYILHFRKEVNLPIYYLAFDLEKRAIVQEI